MKTKTSFATNSMNRSSHHCGTVAALLIVLAFAWVGVGSGLAFEPLDQSRSVHGFVIVPRCGQEAFDDEEAADFGPFAASAVADVACLVASANAAAEQRSDISQLALRARGRADSSAAASQIDTIHAIASSNHSVTFQVETQTQYTLRGRISAGATADNVFVLAGASVQLVDPNGQLLADYAVEPGPGGARQTVVLDQSGILEAGEHTFDTQASTVIDNQVPPNGNAQATFEILLRTPAP
jgi:hypothetical protein